MQEFTHQIKGFSGLRRTSRTKRGEHCCSVATNLMGRNKKIVTPEDITELSALSTTWPTGQLFIFKDCLYCLTASSLVKLLPVQETIIPNLEVGLRWAGLILNDFALFSNGVAKVVYDPTIASFALTRNPWYGLATTLELFDGQVFAGGIDLSALTDIDARIRMAAVHYHDFSPHEYPLDRAENGIFWGAGAASPISLGQLYPSGWAGLFYLDAATLYCHGDDTPYRYSGYPQDTPVATLEPCVFDVALTSPIKKIVTNAYGSAILTTAGKLSVVGEGYCLGLGDEAEHFNKFYQNTLLENVSDIDFTPYDDVGLLLISGKLYGAGYNYCNLLGDIVPTHEFRVEDGGIAESYVELNESAAYKAVAIGASASYAIRDDGILCTCGQIGDPCVGRGEYSYRTRTYYTSFAPVEGPNAAVKFTSISAFTHAVLALSEAGDVYFFGWNHNGISGLDWTWQELEHVMYPTKIPTLSNIVKVIQGYYCCAALDAEGNLYAWGEMPSILDGSVVQPTLIPTKVLEGVEDFTLIHGLPTLIAKTSSGLFRLGDYILSGDSQTDTFVELI
jgi:hypothetical protein